MSRKKYASAEAGYKSRLGARIRVARGERPQGWLAGILRTSTSRVSEWEGGKKEPRANTLTRIAEATGCDLAWLLRDDEEGLTAPRPRLLRIQEIPPVYGQIPEDLRNDERLAKAIDELVEVLRGPDQKATEWLLGNIEVFAREARRHLGVKKRKAG